MKSSGQQVVVTLLLFVAGCSGRIDGSEPQASACGEGKVLVSGRVERDLGTKFQYVGDTSLEEDSLSVVALHSTVAIGGDAPSQLVAEQRLSPAPQPPFDFCVTGAAAEEIDPRLEYYLSVEIRQHARQSSVGDLINESIDRVEPPAQGVVLQVTGLEACSSAEAGGFCTEP